MKDRWEYHILKLRLEANIREAAEELNRLGRDGWELIGTMNNGPFILKRPYEYNSAGGQ
jgi:Domain of unknown function (DUF4177)